MREAKPQVFEIVEHHGTVYTNERTGWALELNTTSWDGKEARPELRLWNADHTTGGKGFVFLDADLDRLVEALTTYMEKRGASEGTTKAMRTKPTDTNF